MNGVGLAFILLGFLSIGTGLVWWVNRRVDAVRTHDGLSKLGNAVDDLKARGDSLAAHASESKRDADGNAVVSLATEFSTNAEAAARRE